MRTNQGVALAVADVDGSSGVAQASNPLAHTLHFHGDNAAMVSVLKSGRNPTMRHLGRTHGVSLTWLKDAIDSGRVDLGYIETDKMAADISTKFSRSAKGKFGPECDS